LIGILLGLAVIAIVAWAMSTDRLPSFFVTPSPPVVSEVTPSSTSPVPGLVTVSPTQTSTSSPTATQTTTPSPTLTSTAIPSATPTLTPTDVPTSTATVSFTPTSTPSPTAIPQPRIVYVSDRTGLSQIYIINSDGTGDTQLTFEGQNDHPFWSDDGQLIFFTSDNGQGLALWSMLPDGSEQTELLTAPDAVSYSISPDSAHTAYAQLTNGEYDIFLDGKQWTYLAGNQVNYQWSPASNFIIIENAASPQVIHVIAVGSLSAVPLTEASYNSWNPVWSPDAVHLAFASTRDGNAGVYTMSIAGGDQIRLTPLDKWSQAPSWSPDGSAIAHVSGEAGGDWSLFIMQANGGGRFRLLTSVHPEAAAVWSPDSGQLAVIIQDGDQELASINRDGGGYRQLTNNTANDWGPVWEP
jgi:Tol biopolymer transport system component